MRTFVQKLPEFLRKSAYYAGQEAAWPREQAIKVIEHLKIHNAVVLGVEVWLPTHPGPTIPTPFIYSWDSGSQHQGESWQDFVRRANTGAAEYVRRFNWDKQDQTHQEADPYFNLEVVEEG